MNTRSFNRRILRGRKQTGSGASFELLESRRLMSDLSKGREADFVLSRLVEFIDCCALLPLLVQHSKRNPAFRATKMAQLFDRYDQLLLSPFDL